MDTLSVKSSGESSESKVVGVSHHNGLKRVRNQVSKSPVQTRSTSKTESNEVITSLTNENSFGQTLDIKRETKSK
jgi:hypothetical protein